MFEKIFGIFRKRKQSDVSQQIPGDMGEDVFGVGDTGVDEDFDAETISLETGMSDGGFSGSSGGGADSGPDFGESGGVTAPPLGDDLRVDLEEEAPAGVVGEEEFAEQGPISPPPEVEPFAPPKRRARKGGLKNVLTTVAVVFVGLALGFFVARPATHMVKKLLTTGPTPEEQLAQVQGENAQLNSQLTGYHSVGSIDQIMAVKNELDKRSEMTDQIKAIEEKVANTPAVEKQIEEVSTRQDKTNRELDIQKGTLANVQKAIKQLEARKAYLVSATRKNLEQIATNQEKAETIKPHLDAESIKRAEAASTLHHDIYNGLGQTTSDALSSS